MIRLCLTISLNSLHGRALQLNEVGISTAGVNRCTVTVDGHVGRSLDSSSHCVCLTLSQIDGDVLDAAGNFLLGLRISVHEGSNLLIECSSDVATLNVLRIDDDVLGDTLERSNNVDSVGRHGEREFTWSLCIGSYHNL